jgi:plasmid stabilization system protein ParE
VARVVVTEAAAYDLAELIHSHRLPADTKQRVRRTLAALADFPELGAELGGALAGRRFVLGPWRWMVIVYRFYPDRDLVAVLAMVDGRTSTSPTANR